MNILLANLGNRNITYKGSVYIKEGNSLDFRQWSLNILENYEDFLDDLDINIINPLVSSPETYDKLLFYYSDMSEFSTRTNQDTLYEAEIIKKLLIDKYNYNQNRIELVHCNAKIYDNGGLMVFYRNSLKKIKRDYNFNRITICDAGGTAQQKMALKIIAEYILKPEKYDVKYTQNNDQIEDVPVVEYRKIIDNEIAIKLLHYGEYNAILDLLEFDNLNKLQYSKKTNTKNIFAHLFFRFTGDMKSAKRNVPPVKSNDILYNFFLGIEDNIALNSLSNITDNYRKIKVADHLRKANFFYKIKKYSQSILCFSQFYESLFEIVIKNDLDNIKFGSISHQNPEQILALKDLIKSKIPKIYEALNNKKDARFLLGDLSTQNLILYFSEIEVFQNISKILSIYIQFSHDAKEPFINKLRNDIAHDGKFITEHEINDSYSFYPILLNKITSAFELKNIDLFEQLNNLVEENLFR